MDGTGPIRANLSLIPCHSNQDVRRVVYRGTPFSPCFLLFCNFSYGRCGARIGGESTMERSGGNLLHGSGVRAVASSLFRGGSANVERRRQRQPEPENELNGSRPNILHLALGLWNPSPLTIALDIVTQPLPAHNWDEHASSRHPQTTLQSNRLIQFNRIFRRIVFPSYQPNFHPTTPIGLQASTHVV